MDPIHQADDHRDPTTTRPVELELLALDLTSCTRCVGTLKNIEEALAIVAPVLEATGARVNLSKVVVESEEQARRLRFVSSPTIRVNGRDVAFELVESPCRSCTDLCGCGEGTSCRVWRHRGEEHLEAPVGLVVEAILRAVFEADREPRRHAPDEHELPENLRRFFRDRAAARAEPSACCPPDEREICCESHQKGSCCHDPEPSTCGCR